MLGPLRRPAALALTLALLVMIPGCGFFSTLDDCSDLARTINPVLVTVRTTWEQGKDRPETYGTVARMYEELAKILKNKQYGARLKELTTQYVELSADVSKNALAFETALRQKRQSKLRVARSTSKQYTAKQRQLNRRIESICRGR